MIKIDELMYINFVNNSKVFLTIEKNRFVIIIINNYIDYNIIYFLNKKLKLLKVFKNYLTFIKIKEISIQRIRFDNKEKYIKYKIIELIKENKVK